MDWFVGDSAIARIAKARFNLRGSTGSSQILHDDLTSISDVSDLTVARAKFYTITTNVPSLAGCVADPLFAQPINGRKIIWARVHAIYASKASGTWTMDAITLTDWSQGLGTPSVPIHYQSAGTELMTEWMPRALIYDPSMYAIAIRCATFTTTGNVYLAMLAEIGLGDP